MTKHRKARVGETMDWILSHSNHNETPCLIWPFSRNGNGRGQMFIGGTMREAHRVMCEVAHGPPPTPKHEAAHNCGKGHLGCVNQIHLRWATSAENKSDRLLHGTENTGTRNGQAKLTEDDVRKIRALQGKISQTEIGRIFCISQTQVGNILRRKKWRHI